MTICLNHKIFTTVEDGGGSTPLINKNKEENSSYFLGTEEEVIH